MSQIQRLYEQEIGTLTGCLAEGGHLIKGRYIQVIYRLSHDG